MTKPRSTRDLLRGEHRLQFARRRRPWFLLSLLVLLLAGYFGWQRELAWRAITSGHDLQSATLQAELERSELRQREAEATQQQLLRRNAELAAQLKRVQTDLAFYRRQQDSH